MDKLLDFSAVFLLVIWAVGLFRYDLGGMFHVLLFIGTFVILLSTIKENEFKYKYKQK